MKRISWFGEVIIPPDGLHSYTCIIMADGNVIHKEKVKYPGHGGGSPTEEVMAICARLANNPAFLEYREALQAVGKGIQKPLSNSYFPS